MAKVILVAGYLAGGKTTFARALSEALQIPAFHKDTIKAALGEHLPIRDRAESKALSHATFGAMCHMAECCMRTHTPLILESNFTPEEGEVLQALLGRHHCPALTFLLTGDLRVLHARFLERERNEEREVANRSFGLLDDFSAYAASMQPLGEFAVGEQLIRIDTTEVAALWHPRYVAMARDFLAQAGQG